MSLRKKLGSYLLAGLVALSTLGSSLMSIPASADIGYNPSTPGNSVDGADMNLGWDNPMFAIYLAGSEELSDDNARCTAEQAESIIRNFQAIDSRYRDDAIYYFPNGMKSWGKTYLAAGYTSQLSAPTYYGALKGAAPDETDLSSRCITSLDQLSSDRAKDFLKAIFADVKLNERNGKEIGKDIAKKIRDNYEAFRQKHDFSPVAEYEYVSALFGFLDEDNENRKDAENRYENNKPVTLIIELYLPNTSNVSHGANFYLSAFSQYNVGGTQTWTTRGKTTPQSVYTADNGTRYFYYNCPVCYAFGGWGTSTGAMTYGDTFFPSHNSKYSLDGKETPFDPKDTGHIGGWGYFSFCSDPETSRPKLVISKDIEIDNPAYNTSEIKSGINVRMSLSGGFTAERLKAEGIERFVSDTDITVEEVAKFFAEMSSTEAPSYAAQTLVRNGFLEDIDGDVKNAYTSLSGLDENGKKTFAEIMLNPLPNKKTFYLVSEGGCQPLPTLPDGLSIKDEKGSAAGVICVDATGSDLVVTFASLASQGSEGFKNNDITCSYDSASKIISLDVTNGLTVDGEIEEGDVGTLVPLVTIADVDQYYVDGYPIDPAKRLVYTDLQLANGSKNPFIQAWGGTKTTTALNNNISNVISGIVDTDKPLISNIDAKSASTNATFKASDTYSYRLVFMNPTQKGSFNVKDDYTKTYTFDTSDLAAVTDADEAVSAVNAHSNSFSATKGTKITDVKLDGETLTVPSAGDYKVTTSEDDISINDVKANLEEYSDFAKKYAAYEIAVAKSANDISYLLQYWTKAAWGLYGGAKKEWQEAYDEATRTPKVPASAMQNSSLSADFSYGRATFVDGSPLIYPNFNGVAIGCGSTSSAARAACEKNIPFETNLAEVEASRAKINKYAEALKKLTGWQMNCSLPYVTNSIKNLKYREFYFTGTSRGGSRYVCVAYNPASNKATNWQECNGYACYTYTEEGIGYPPDRDDYYDYASYREAVKDFAEDKQDTVDSCRKSMYATMAEAMTEHPEATFSIRAGSTYEYDYWGKYYWAYAYIRATTTSGSAQVSNKTEYKNLNGTVVGSRQDVTLSGSGKVSLSQIPKALADMVKGTSASVKTTAPTSVGGYLGDAIQLAWDTSKKIAELESNRPSAEIHVYQDMTREIADYDDQFQNVDIKQYMLTMRWEDVTPFVKGNTYLAQVLDRNPAYKNTDLAGDKGTIKTTALLTATTNANSFSYKINGESHTSPIVFGIQTAETKWKDIATLKAGLPSNTPNRVVQNNKFTLGTAKYAIPNTTVKNTDLDTLAYIYAKFGVFANTWVLDDSNELERYLPSADWAKKLSAGDKSLVDTASQLANAKRANKADVASATSISGSDYATISSLKYSENPANMKGKMYYSGTTLNESMINYFLSNAKFSGSKLNEITEGIAKGANIWSTSDAVYKLSATFNGFTPDDTEGSPYIPAEFVPYKADGTKSTDKTADLGTGIYTRDDEYYNIYPLVKMAYYQSPASSALSYTYIIGQKARDLKSYVYYELGLSGDATPTVYANALASNTNASVLGTSVAGGTAPVAYSGTGLTVTYEGDMSFVFQSYNLVDKDAEATYQQEWGNTTSSESAHTQWLESLGANPSTLTSSNGTVSQAYTLGYIPGASVGIRNKAGTQFKEDAWYLTNDKVVYMREDTSKSMMQDIDLTIVGTELQGVRVKQSYFDPTGAKNNAGTYTGKTTAQTLAKLKSEAPSVYRALVGMDISTILKKTFVGNAGEAVMIDYNGNVADQLRATGNNWYNEYVYCMALRLQSTTMTMEPPTFTDKIPIELGPKTPANKRDYFSDGYGFIVQKFLVKFAGTPDEIGADAVDTTWVKDRGRDAHNDLIIADVPVTAAN